MLVPFYWVLKTSLTGENIFAYPPSILPQDIQPFFYVDAWYAIPFARFFLNSVVVAVDGDRRQPDRQRRRRLCADQGISGQARTILLASWPA